MSVLRLFNPQGLAGIAASICLAALLLLQKDETRHWRKESSRLEQLYSNEQAAFAGTVANVRAATEAARVADRRAAERARAEQTAINERTANDYEIRLAAARARAERLRIQAGDAATDPRRGGIAAVSGLPAPAGGASEGSGQDRFSPADALTATEQAIQLDELIKWVRLQHAVRVDGMPGERSQAAEAQAEVDKHPANGASSQGD